MADVAATPVFSKYVDFRNGYEVGIHKFIVSPTGPLWGQNIQWDVKRMAPGTNTGRTLSIANQDTEIVVTPVSTTTRVTAQCDLAATTSWATKVRPLEIYVATFHFGAANSSDRTVVS